MAFARLGIVSFVLLCASCASTPEASPERDAAAKEFEAVTRDAVIYVYRPDARGTSTNTTLWVDERLNGESLPRTYFRNIVFPGRNVIETSPPDSGRIVVRTHPSEVIYVEMRTTGGSEEGSPSSHFRVMPAKEAQAAIRACCTRLEIWHHGQPRLLW